jgi:beta-xylosidase
MVSIVISKVSRNLFYTKIILILTLFCTSAIAAVRNPIIHADFSDPDVVVHNGVFYMVSSSFTHFPGIPVLTSLDGISWERLNFVMPVHPDLEGFSEPQHGKGLWAPCIRVFENKFYVFIPDPDRGIYVATSDDPAKGWSKPKLILEGKGIIDPTPLWHEGKAYLLHAWAKSRAGFNNVLTLHEMTADASRVLDDGKVIIDGNALPNFRTLEGPKFYKRNGFFYVFAPAGGVKEGWQTVFRSRHIYGPYDYRITLEQGSTDVNGPHQGAWIEHEGKDWFYHFQDVDTRGRVVHLQPLRWRDDWPLMGEDYDGNGVGEPVIRLASLKNADQKPLAGLTYHDDFSNEILGKQWQWHANPNSDWYHLRKGQLILSAQPAKVNLWQQPAVLSQMLIGPRSQSEMAIDLSSSRGELNVGLVVFGTDYTWLGVEVRQGQYQLVLANCIEAIHGTVESRVFETELPKEGMLYLKAEVNDSDVISFSYRLNEGGWKKVDAKLLAKPGRWVGTRVGMFAQGMGEVHVESFDQSN